MSELFLKVLNNSISAGWLVLAVMAFRIIFRKAPKWINCLLWGVVALRLICPVSLVSPISLLPSAETVSPDIIYARHPAVDTGIPMVNNAVNPLIDELYAPTPAESANPLQIEVFIWSIIWIIGIGIMLLGALISYVKLRLRLRTAVRVEGNIFRSEFISTPFVMGIFRPVIFLPGGLNERTEFVIAHERTHIRHRDNLSKPFGYLLLAVFWFNPLIWAAYILFCRDLEMCCDEAVISRLSNEEIADYSEALLKCSARGHIVNACPVAFGESGVKTRIRKILNYRKAPFWLMAAAIIVCIIIAVCFLTDPKKPATDGDSHNPENILTEDGSSAAGNSENRDNSVDITGAKATDQTIDGMAAEVEEPIGFLNDREQPEKVGKFLEYWNEIKKESKLIKAAGIVRDEDIREKPEYELIREVSFAEGNNVPSPIIFGIMVAYEKEMDSYSFFENGVFCRTSLYSSNFWSGEYYLAENIEEIIEKTKEIIAEK